MKLKILFWDCEIKRTKFRKRTETNECGEKYTVEDMGEFSHPAYVKAKILLDERLNGKKLMEIAIHECLHAFNPWWDEKYVVKASKALTDLLWSLGFRQSEESEI